MNWVVITDNELIIVNASTLCKGLITRHRETINGVEESVLDHFLVCSDMFQLIRSMVIDEEGKFPLTKYANKTGTQTCVKHIIAPSSFILTYSKHKKIHRRKLVLSYLTTRIRKIFNALLP